MPKRNPREDPGTSNLDITIPPERVEQNWRAIDNPGQYIQARWEALSATNSVLAMFLMDTALAKSVEGDTQSYDQAGLYMQAALFTHEQMQRIPAYANVVVDDHHVRQYKAALLRGGQQQGENFYDITVDVIEHAAPKLSAGIRDIAHGTSNEVGTDFLQGFLDVWNLLSYASLQSSMSADEGS